MTSQQILLTPSFITTAGNRRTQRLYNKITKYTLVKSVEFYYKLPSTPVWSYHSSTEVWSLSIKSVEFFIPHSMCTITAHFLCDYCLPTCLSYSSFECLPACRSDCLSLCLLVCPSGCLSVCLSVCQSACLSCCLFACIVCLYICSSACMSVSVFA